MYFSHRINIWLYTIFYYLSFLFNLNISLQFRQCQFAESILTPFISAFPLRLPDRLLYETDY